MYDIDYIALIELIASRASKNYWDMVWSNKPHMREHFFFVKKIYRTLPIYELVKKIVGERGGRRAAKDFKLLEAGSGSGLYSLFMAREFGFAPTLLDNSSEALKTSEENARILGVRAVFRKGDVQRLPFPTNSFDVVFSMGLNEHFASARERRNAFREMIRVTKPGGVTFVEVPNKNCLPYSVGKLVREATGIWRRGMETPYTRGEVAGILAQIRCEREFKEFTFEYRIWGTRFLSAFAWLLFGRPSFLLRNKLDELNVKIPLADDLLGYSLNAVVYKRRDNLRAFSAELRTRAMVSLGCFAGVVVLLRKPEASASGGRHKRLRKK